jgi:hypothetical protein
MNSTDPRLSMARLPQCLQMPITFAIGKSLPGQFLPAISPGRHLIGFTILHLLGLLLSAVAVYYGGIDLLLVPYGLYFTVVGARHLQVGGVHHMVHGCVAEQAPVDDLLGRLISQYLFIEEYGSYKKGHLKHHSHDLSTDNDPTVQSLRAAGLVNGASVAILRRRLMFSCVSPPYHMSRLWARFRSYWVPRPSWRSAVATAYLLVLISIAVRWPVFAFIWILPMSIGYQAASLVRAVVEHWPENPAACGREGYLHKTSAFFCGVTLPQRQRSKWANAFVLTRWTIQMMLEIGCRALFVAADGPNHDLHHIKPSTEWANDIAWRREFSANSAAHHIVLSETWGFFRTLRLHLLAMSEAEIGSS